MIPPNSRTTLLIAALATALLGPPALAAGGKSIEVEGPRGKILGFLATPEGDGPFPAVVVAPDWFGLTDWAKQNAIELARRGYVALAVDLYGGATTDDPLVAFHLARALDHSRAVADLKAAADFLKASANVRRSRPVGAIGWGLGGTLAGELAESSDAVGPVVICYGSIADDHRLARLKEKPALLILGGDDRGLPAARFDAIARAIGPNLLIKVYPGAGHAFMRPDPPGAKLKGYNAEADKEARAEIIGFFKKHL